MSGIKEAELWRLHQVVLQIESMIANHALGSGPAANVLHRMLSEAESSIGAICEEQKLAKIEKEEKSVRELAIAYQVEREAALNAAERVQYESFLKKDWFTKADFDSLEKFYTNSYDKLTDGGKAEMSTRVWEGVRRKEYEFIELPDIVKEKEAGRLHEVFSASRKMPTELQRIPQNDRQDFMREWDAGNKAASYQVLNRPSFAENVSLSAKRVASEDRKVTSQELAAGILTVEHTPEEPAKGTGGSAGGKTELKLDDVLLISNENGKVEAPLPGAKGSSLTKGG